MKEKVRDSCAVSGTKALIKSHNSCDRRPLSGGRAIVSEKVKAFAPRAGKKKKKDEPLLTGGCTTGGRQRSENQSEFMKGDVPRHRVGVPGLGKHDAGEGLHPNPGLEIAIL